MTIDWDKPLECSHGAVDRKQGILSDWVEVSCGNAYWVVKNETGEPLDGWMPHVYNAKRKPKEGEWWMCREKVGAVLTERPYCLRNGRWRVSSMGLAYFPIDSVEPLYPLIKDPDF